MNADKVREILNSLLNRCQQKGPDFHYDEVIDSVNQICQLFQPYNEDKSKCCSASVSVSSSDEETNYYVCSECGNPCDILGDMPLLTMTEKEAQFITGFTEMHSITYALGYRNGATAQRDADALHEQAAVSRARQEALIEAGEICRGKVEQARREMHDHINEMLSPVGLALFRMTPTESADDYGLADKYGDPIDIVSILKPVMDEYHKQE